MSNQRIQPDDQGHELRAEVWERVAAEREQRMAARRAREAQTQHGAEARPA